MTSMADDDDERIDELFISHFPPEDLEHSATEDPNQNLTRNEPTLENRMKQQDTILTNQRILLKNQDKLLNLLLGSANKQSKTNHQFYQNRAAPSPLLSVATTKAQHKQCTSLTEKEVHNIKFQSCSVGNFAVNCVRMLFSAEELRVSNVNGTNGKNRSDASRMQLVWTYVQKTYINFGDAEKEQWKRCVVAVNEFLRRPGRRIYGHTEF